eukprot:TRINITY_DN6366_c0_g1_i4.p1 TRINITY_DN6366_c0_g1~~TRINITY_DN6366_c0_g1_i4.p1  ORF type:complete len:78 (-),score=7.67 TRINITY_DN6366_c0_g1_i4:50-283(-)
MIGKTNTFVSLLVVLLLCCFDSVQAQQDSVQFTSDGKAGFAVIAIIVALAAIGMLIRVKDVYDDTGRAPTIREVFSQ